MDVISEALSRTIQAFQNIRQRPITGAHLFESLNFDHKLYRPSTKLLIFTSNASTPNYRIIPSFNQLICKLVPLTLSGNPTRRRDTLKETDAVSVNTIEI